MALIKGRSDSSDLEHMSHMIHILLFSLRCWIYSEWIPSKSNWSDAISRDGHADRWHHDQGFTSRIASFFGPLWYFPFPATLRVALRAYRGPLFLDQPASRPAGRPAKNHGPAG